ncbi:MAG: XRE family transcriptional regulator [Acidithiobacillus sp.]
MNGYAPQIRQPLRACQRALAERETIVRPVRLFGVTQPRVSDLVRGKINLFSLDMLVNMATAAGLHIELRVLNAA